MNIDEGSVSRGKQQLVASVHQCVHIQENQSVKWLEVGRDIQGRALRSPRDLTPVPHEVFGSPERLIFSL